MDVKELVVRYNCTARSSRSSRCGAKSIVFVEKRLPPAGRCPEGGVADKLIYMRHRRFLRIQSTDGRQTTRTTIVWPVAIVQAAVGRNPFSGG